MQASGIFYVTDVNRAVGETLECNYTEVDMTDISFGRGDFRSIFMGNGIEAGKTYEMKMEMIVHSNCSFDSQIIEFKALDEIVSLLT